MNDQSSEERNVLEPVFPIYLDVEMLTGFLATLEGGFSLSSDVSSSQGSAQSSSKSGSLAAGTSSLLNQLFRIDFSGNIEGSKSDDDREEIRFVLQHTEVSLFNRLRTELYDLNMVKAIDEGTDTLPPLGSIVEFEGVIQSNPLAKVLSILSPVMSILEPGPPLETPKGKGISNQGKPRKPIADHAEEQAFGAHQPSPGEVLRLLTEEQANSPLQDMVIAVDSPACNSMILTLRRTTNIEEANAHFLGSRCVVLGKVSGYIGSDEDVPLYRRSILAVMGDRVTRPFFSSLSQFDIDLASLSVSGPALQILPLAIYV